MVFNTHSNSTNFTKLRTSFKLEAEKHPLCSECDSLSAAEASYQSGILGPHAGSLHQQLLVSQLHAVQPCDRLESQHTHRHTKGTMSWIFLIKQFIDSSTNNPSQSSLMTH